MRLSHAVLAVALLLGASAAQPAVAALPACSSAAEKNAMVVRSLQSYLMVAGVGCNQAGAYNKFMTKYQQLVSMHGGVLRSYFSRVYGGSGERQLNNFITGIANAWSQKHMADMTTYCKGTWDMMWQLDKLASADNAKLLELGQAVSVQPVVADELCSGAVTTTQVAQASPPHAPSASAPASTAVSARPARR